MKFKTGLIIFLLPVLGLFSWFVYLEFQDNDWNEINVPISGYDPYQPLAGHYILFKADETAFKEIKKSADNGKNSDWKIEESMRFYVPQSYASEFEKVLNDKRYKCVGVFRYKKGRTPNIKTVLIDGVDWRKFFRKTK